MDTVRRRHGGVAPVVVVVDPNGTAVSNTLCMDSLIARADTFLAEDVPAWINGTLDVDPATRNGRPADSPSERPAPCRW